MKELIFKNPLFKKLITLVPYLLFVLISLFLFRNYFFKNQVPFSSNLLVSFYKPWSAYKWDNFPNGPPAKPIGFDDLRMFYPIRTVVTDTIINGHLPLWNPYSFAGNTLLGTYQIAVFHPLAWLFLLLPQIDAWSIIVILSPIFCLIFTYLFLREIGFDKRVAIFGALIFGCSGMMIVWWEEMFMSVYSTLTLPAIFYAIHRLNRKISPSSFAIFIAGLLISILSGYFQTTFYIFGFAAVWTLFLAIKNNNRVKFLITIIGGFIISLLLSGLQLVPSFEAYQLSARGSTDVYLMFKEFFAPLNHIITLIAPDFYGNPATQNYFANSFYHEKVIWISAAGLFFVVYEIISILRTRKMSLFFLFFGVIIMSLGFSLPTSWFFLYQLKLPFLNTLTPSRIFYLSSFCLSVVASFGLQKYLTKPNSLKSLLTSLIFVISLLFLWKLAIGNQKIDPIKGLISVHSLYIPTILLAITSAVTFFYSLISQNSIVRAIFSEECARTTTADFSPHVVRSKNKYEASVYYLLLVINLTGIFFFANKYLFFGERKYVFPEVPVITKLKEIQGIDRYWSLGDGAMIRNFENQYQLYSPEGYESFNIKRYNELSHTTHTAGKLTSNLDRADASIRLINNLDELHNNYYSRKMLDLVGVKYIFALHQNYNQPQLDQVNFKLIWTDGIYDIFENTTALPRFFLTSQYQVITDDQKIIDTLYAKNSDNRTLVLEEDPLITSLNDKTSTVNLISYQPEKIEFKTNSSNNALLFLSDNDFPGWKAYVDGQENKIYRANYSFRSVLVPAGQHQVKFVYEPKTVKIGTVVSGIGIIIFIGVIFYLKKFSTNKNSLEQ